MSRRHVLVLLAASVVACGGKRPPPVSPSSGAGSADVEEATGAEDEEGSLAPGLGPRPEPKEIAFDGCAPEGDGGDPDLNLLKNRVDTPVSVNDAGVQQVLGLLATASKKHREDWTQEQRDRIAKHEGTPIRIEGYLAGAKLEGAESPNCHEDDGAHEDFHLYLIADSGDEKALSIVVEMTPRVRKDHPGWTISTLRTLAKEKDEVRVSGWLMFDEEHASEVGKSRGSLWEIHPITSFEVKQQDAWVAL